MNIFVAFFSLYVLGGLLFSIYYNRIYRAKNPRDPSRKDYKAEQYVTLVLIAFFSVLWPLFLFIMVWSRALRITEKDLDR